MCRLAPEILAVQAAGTPGSGRGSAGAAVSAAPPAWAAQVLESVAAAARLPNGVGAQGGAYAAGNYTAAERRELARRLETQSTAAWLLQKLNGRGGSNCCGAAGGAYGYPAGYGAGYGTSGAQLPPPGVLGGGGGQLGAFGGGGVSVQDGGPPSLSVEREWDTVARVGLDSSTALLGNLTICRESAQTQCPAGLSLSARFPGWHLLCLNSSSRVLVVA